MAEIMNKNNNEKRSTPSHILKRNVMRNNKHNRDTKTAILNSQIVYIQVKYATV